MYFHFVFIKVFKFLLEYRSLIQGIKEKKTGETAKKINKLIIVLIIFLFLINLFNAANVILIAIFMIRLGKDYIQSDEQ